MIGSVIIPALWIIALGFVFLKVPFFTDHFSSVTQMNTAFFAFFIWSALWNGFNVRSDKFAIFSRLSENPGFLKVLTIIAVVQAVIINIGSFDNSVCQTISKMFSCVPFGLAEWGIVALLSFTIIPVASVAKLVIKGK
jgi:magnesium-transporting ATPase (P-type)